MCVCLQWTNGQGQGEDNCSWHRQMLAYVALSVTMLICERRASDKHYVYKIDTAQYCVNTPLDS